MSEKLTPCPFCGGRAFVWQSNKATYIQCEFWNTSDENGHLVQVSAKTREDAVKKWQGRFIMRESLREAQERVLDMIGD